MGLQYSFPNTKSSFYDKKCGQFFIQEINSRLQNYFEYVRRQIFINGKGAVDENGSPIQLNLHTLDISARDYKYKYVIEKSYTELDYKFFKQYIRAVGEDKVLKTFKLMSGEYIQRMVHNIFPQDDEGIFQSNGNTILHYLAKFSLGFEVVDFIGKLAKKDSFVIPFLVNSDRQTPLDITVNLRDHK